MIWLCVLLSQVEALLAKAALRISFAAAAAVCMLGLSPKLYVSGCYLQPGRMLTFGCWRRVFLRLCPAFGAELSSLVDLTSGTKLYHASSYIATTWALGIPFRVFIIATAAPWLHAHFTSHCA